MNTNVNGHDVTLVGKKAPPRVLSRGRLAVLLALTAAPVILTTVVMTVLAVTRPRDRTFAGLSGNILSIAVYAASNWVTFAVVWFVAGRTRLRALGMKWRFSSGRFAEALAGFVVGVVIYLVVTSLQRRGGFPTTGGMNFGTMSAAELTVLAAAAVVTAAFCEEVFFRVLWVGAVATRLPVKVAAALSILAFAAIHYPYFGVGGVVFITAWSVVPVVLFIRAGDFTPSLLMHLINNSWAYLIVPVFF